ncbi:MAG TPA: hypothetical protein VLJ76_04570 [Gaiellaceae bacterium]|nr:hypothetical protein [Gaiellaceae bacterium]
MRTGSILAGTCFIAALTAAAFAGSPGPAAAAVTYSCTGSASVDEATLQPLIAAGDSIALRGPASCAGNYVADGVTVTITGAGRGATMDGGGTGSILLLDDATVALVNLTLTNGNGSGPDEPGDPSGANGGAVSMTDSTLTVTGCRLVGNRAGDQGGAIHAAESELTVTASTISDNTSEEGGGGIDADDDVDLAISKSTVSGNATGPHGGGVELFDGTLTVTGSTISGNRLTDTTDFRSGAGIWTGLSVVSIAGSTVKGNVSPEFGGGIGFSGGPGSSLTIRGSIVTGNRATVGGGGIRNDAYYGDAPLVVDHSTVTGNFAGQGGGIDAYALHGFTSSVSLTSSSVAMNRAPGGLGGGVDGYVDPSGGATTIDVASTTVAGNQAAFGGGIAATGAYGSAAVTLRPGATLVGNSAQFDGGGVYTRDGATLAFVPGIVMRLNFPDNVAAG